MPKILVVEDSQMMRVFYKQILESLAKNQLTLVKNGQEALDLIAAQGEPDVIVLDVNMPVMDGIEFLENFKKTSKGHARVIIVSTEGKEDDLKRGMDAGANAYMTKPFTPETLRQKVRGLLEQAAADGDKR